MATVASTVLYPKVASRDWGTRNGLNPLNMSLLFEGSVPNSRIFFAEMRLKVTITLPRDCAGITPVIKSGPLDFMYGSNSLQSVLCQNQRGQSGLDIPLSFLPLHSSFNPYNAQCWIGLMNKIQRWLLIEVVDRHSLEWTWGREVFWMAYIAAYPEFPNGRWTIWSLKISPEGSFLEGWMTKCTSAVQEEIRLFNDNVDYVSTRGAIWERFQDTVALIFDGRVISAGI
ncbi:hypothetical protein SERLADRAFT_404586 [Serpula lacrymans var. lacrymans S7.9]|uniref:Uncharacterized protein n=1 Tax=Serpula lacrymans var. lacrymans (strain S7.9) TaxID=578457 RepID=F8NDS7_SERL9|nr:uncharacterized protein SERLADRAFT_404586 [Serpula lacrymans var. lacrymans S7.9]EGO30401.1 hypothetical protein SERLADRAFT_404586 [Serpula lacrymans var. lacrymans S7.9]